MNKKEWGWHGSVRALLELVEHNIKDTLGDTNLTGCSFYLDKEIKEALWLKLGFVPEYLCAGQILQNFKQERFCISYVFYFFRSFQSFWGLFSVYKFQKRSQSSFISLHINPWIFLHIHAWIFWWDSSVMYQQGRGHRMSLYERNKVKTTRKVQNTNKELQKCKETFGNPHWCYVLIAVP